MAETILATPVEPGTSTPEPTAATVPTAADARNAGIVTYLKERLESSKDGRKQYFSEWRGNVQRRIGRTAMAFTTGVRADDENQAELNPDWSLTKTKTANLFSQVPTVQLTHVQKNYGPAVSPFAKSINYEIGDKRAHIGTAMNEVLNDVVNASGIGGVEVGYAARFETKSVPQEDSIAGPQGPLPTKDLPPEVLQQLADKGLVHMVDTPFPVSQKFYVTRFSPTELLTPREFTGSCFDDGDLIGRSGRMSWADAIHEFRLKETDKENVLAGYEGNGADSMDNLRSTQDRESALANVKAVRYDVVYYWRHRFDPDEKHFDCIWKLVMVAGKEEPVIHEPWKGQRLDPKTNRYIGAVKFPIRVLTLTYITDNPIPPSDTAAGRPQVDDMRRSRQQMFQNRERSIPMRWFDVNRVDPTIQTLLMAGNWQGMIPCNGPGDRSFGEVARAAYPSEDLAFDQAAKQDLLEAWHIGPNQQGVGSARQTATQVENVQANFATVIGQERAAVATFFLGIVEVVAGLMALYSDFPILSDQEREAMMQAWDRTHILHDLAFSIRPDSTVLLDAPARLQRLSTFLNLTVQSGYVNPLPIITEMAELSGLDPAEVIVTPTPKTPEDPNVSYRFSGKDDLMNVAVMAMLVKHKQAPSPEDMKAAKAILLATQTLVDDPAPPAGANAPAGAAGPDGELPPSPDGSAAITEPATPDAAHKDWTLGPRIMKRSRDMNG